MLLRYFNTTNTSHKGETGDDGGWEGGPERERGRDAEGYVLFRFGAYKAFVCIK